MSASARKPRILIVDDDADFLESTSTVLQSAGYEVFTAADEQSGTDRLEELAPDLLLLDVMMSQWDSGFRMLWNIKSRDRFAALPVLMLTAVDREMDVDFASHANTGIEADEEYLPVAGYVIKPVDPERLKATVARILREAERGAPG